MRSLLSLLLCLNMGLLPVQQAAADMPMDHMQVSDCGQAIDDLMASVAADVIQDCEHCDQECASGHCFWGGGLSVPASDFRLLLDAQDLAHCFESSQLPSYSPSSLFRPPRA